MNILIVVCAAGLLAGLLYCEKKEVLKAKLAVKTVLSCLFIFAAVIQSHPNVWYYRFVLLGLIFCLGGDVFLALPREEMFRFRHLCCPPAIFKGCIFQPARGIASVLWWSVSFGLLGWMVKAGCNVMSSWGRSSQKNE